MENLGKVEDEIFRMRRQTELEYRAEKRQKANELRELKSIDRLSTNNSNKKNDNKKTENQLGHKRLSPNGDEGATNAKVSYLQNYKNEKKYWMFLFIYQTLY
jgi:ribosomal protein S4